jgi:1-pyrroline-5-carboxylate dehydrogenase
MITEFKNEPYLDFTKEEERRRMAAAIDGVERDLGREYPLVIGGERVHTSARIRSIDPSDPERVVGLFSKAGPAEVERAIEAASRAFRSWWWVPARERAAVLLRAAGMLRKRRHEFNALLALEAGKTFPEADAETAEAIDFCEFYAREALRLLSDTQPVTPFPGEKNELVYIPLGVGVVIPPWNFSLAILAGMTTAAIVAGNTVLLKPSSDTPLVAWRFFELLEAAGVPAGVVNFVTGSGGVAGETAARDPRIRFIAFTGSKDVGLRLAKIAGEVPAGQRWIKRAVLEMGGKDFIVVSSHADLDDAAAGVAAAAFEYQGQKCSACSRAIVDVKVYDVFVQKLVAKVGELSVGPAKDPKNHMGPVINAAAMESILGFIEVGKKEGRLVAGGERAPGRGFFIRPTVFADVPRTARLFREEIFGPVLAVTRARDFDEAIELANDTEYGLTGALYSRDREELRRGKRLLHCGNLYLNRKCTGAMVGVHPFGGFNMSGTDSKAGGRDYLLLFTQAKSISEKVA